MQTRSAALLFLALVVGFSSDPLQAGKKKPPPPPIPVRGAPYEGTLGETRIQARLTLDAPGSGGWYWTEIESPDEETPPLNYGNPSKIVLRTRDGDALTLDVLDEGGLRVAVITGRISPGGAISGQWLRENGGRKLSFSLSPLASAPPHFTLTAFSACKEDSQLALYSILVVAPQCSCPTDPGLESRINGIIREMTVGDLDEIRQDFKNGFREARQQDNYKNLVANGNASSYELTYQIVHSSPRILSVLFTISRYDIGTPEPRTLSRTLNLDLADRENLTLPEIFRPGVEWLPRLSAFCVRDLKDTIAYKDDGWIEKGAAPDLGNYRSFLVLQDGLRIFFDSYQVAQYAAGRQEVDVPFTVLNGLIKSAFTP